MQGNGDRFTSPPALTGSQNIYGAAERLQNVQHFFDLCCRLTCFEIDNETDPNAGDASKLVLS